VKITPEAIDEPAEAPLVPDSPPRES